MPRGLPPQDVGSAPSSWGPRAPAPLRSLKRVAVSGQPCPLRKSGEVARESPMKAFQSSGKSGLVICESGPSPRRRGDIRYFAVCDARICEGKSVRTCTAHGQC